MNWFRLRTLALALLVTVLAPACSTTEPNPAVQAEIASRESYAKALALDSGATTMLGVASRSNVLFEEGFSNIEYDPPNDFHNRAFRWMGKRGHIRLHSNGGRPATLKVTGWLHEKELRAKGVVALYLDGRYIRDTGAVEDGVWWIETLIQPELLRGARWHDLVITVSAVAYHWSDPPALHVVVINSVDWSEGP